MALAGVAGDAALAAGSGFDVIDLLSSELDTPAPAGDRALGGADDCADLALCPAVFSEPTTEFGALPLAEVVNTVDLTRDVGRNWWGHRCTVSMSRDTKRGLVNRASAEYR